LLKKKEKETHKLLQKAAKHSKEGANAWKREA
jgi:hypothetical protein